MRPSDQLPPIRLSIRSSVRLDTITNAHASEAKSSSLESPRLDARDTTAVPAAGGGTCLCGTRARALRVPYAAPVTCARLGPAARLDRSSAAGGDVAATSEPWGGTPVTLSGALIDGVMCVDGPSGRACPDACGAGSGLGVSEPAGEDAAGREESGAGMLSAALAGGEARPSKHRATVSVSLTRARCDALGR